MFILISNKLLNRKTHRVVLYQHIGPHPYKINAKIIMCHVPYLFVFHYFCIFFLISALAELQDPLEAKVQR